MESFAAENKNILHSVDTALQLMDLLEQNSHLSLTEISRALSIGKSTAFRLCYTLERRGYILRREDGSYGLGIRLLCLGTVAKDRMEIVHFLRPLLMRLNRKTDETIHLVVWADSYRVVLVDEILGSGSIRVVSDVKAPRYPHETSTGMTLLAAKPDEYIQEYLRVVPLKRKTPKAYGHPDQILAAIDQIRRQGYSLNDQLYEVGLMSIAVPVYNSAHSVVGAISISGLDTRLRPRLDEFLAALRSTAAEAAELPF